MSRSVTPFMRRTRRRPSSSGAFQGFQRRRTQPPARVSIPRNIAKALKGVEKKFITRVLSSTAITAAWAGGEMNVADGCVNGITQGDGDSERIGKAVTFDSVYVHGLLTIPALDGTVVQNPISVRLIWFMDTQTNGVQANAEDVMDDAAGTKFLAFRNALFLARFKILYDRTITVTPMAAAGNGTANDTASAHRTWKAAFRNLNMNVTYSATASTIPSVTNNSIQCACVASTTGCNLLYIARGYYFD